jgi:hypothetical protein
MHDMHKHNDVLIMTKRQTSCVVACLLFDLFMSFMVGYFLGTKHATEEFIAQMQQDLIAEQLLASACIHPTEKKAIPVSATVPISSSDTTQQQQQQHAALLATNTQEKELVAEIASEYAAELIGFGKREAAQQFINRIAKDMDIELELRTRQSKHQKGKTVTWYQVVTKRYKDKKELDTIVKMIAKKESLHNINIVTCTQA